MPSQTSINVYDPSNKAWLEGIKACEEKVSRDNCPYAPPSAEAISWCAGYDMASIILYPHYGSYKIN
jgi:hypothetical protein